MNIENQLVMCIAALQSCRIRHYQYLYINNTCHASRKISAPGRVFFF